MEFTKCVLVFALCGVMVLSAVLNLDKLAELQDIVDSGETIDAIFADFKMIFRRHYSSKNEDGVRKQIFGENVEFILRHNERDANGVDTYTLGTNQFTDLTEEEFRHGIRTPRLPSSWFNSRLNHSHVDKNKCKKSSNVSRTRIRDYDHTTLGDEEALKKAVAEICRIVASVNSMGLHIYRSGVLTPRVCPSAPEKLKHAILIVGYGTEHGVDYWFIKNTYGPGWVERGYLTQFLPGFYYGIVQIMYLISPLVLQ